MVSEQIARYTLTGHHTFRQMGPKTSPPTIVLPSTDAVSSQMIDAITLEDTAQQSEQQAAGTSESVENEPTMQNDAENVDSLPHRCFAAALLHRLPRDSDAFPYDAGQFYSHCLLRCVPAGARLDMRHTRYKKFIVFLREMAGVERVVDIREQAPGVWAVVSVDCKHDMLTRFTPTDEQLTDAVDKCVHVRALTVFVMHRPEHAPPVFDEVYLITKLALPVVNVYDKTLKREDADL